jgi:ParB-like chromosome segregation protein Spo0J
MAKKTKAAAETQAETSAPAAVRLKNFFTVPLDLISADPADNGRWPGDTDSDSDATDLVTGMAASGQEQPLKATLNEDGTYRLRFGFRRYAALCQIRDAGLFGEGFFYQAVPEAKVEVVSGLGDKEAFLSNLEENGHRKDPGPMGNAYNCNRLISEFGMTHGEVAKFMAKSDAWVTQMLTLLQLPVKIQKRIQAGEMGSGAGYELAGMEKKLRNRTVQNLDERGERITVTSIRQEAAALGSAVGGETEPPAGYGTSENPEAGSESELPDTEADGSEDSDSDSGSAPASTRGRKRKEQSERVSLLTSKYVHVFFLGESKKFKEEDGPSIWNELAGYISEFIAGGMTERTLVKRGKKACGIE